MPVTVPVLRVLEVRRGQRNDGPLILRPNSGKLVDRRDVYRMVPQIAKVAGIPLHISPMSARSTLSLIMRKADKLCDAQLATRRAVVM